MTFRGLARGQNHTQIAVREKYVYYSLVYECDESSIKTFENKYLIIVYSRSLN